MVILIGYFVWVVSTLAVIVTVWIGVAESGAERLHLQRTTAIQHSYDAAVMAGGGTALAPAKAKPSRPRRVAARPRGRQRARFDPRLALRADPPPPPLDWR